MKRRMMEWLLLLALIGMLPACATPLTYSAKEIRGQIVDAETNQPIDGAVIAAQWVLFHIGPGHGGHKSRIHIHETVTGKNGNYAIPAWGPKVRPPMTELHERDPQLLIFKSGYESLGLSNPTVSTVRPGSLRVSEWDGRVIKLKKQKANIEEHAFKVGIVIRDSLEEREWKSFPRMVLALDAENRRLDSLGLKPGYRFRILFIEKLSEVDRQFLKRYEK